MRNLKVRGKLLLSFGIVIGCAVIISILAIFGMSSLHAENNTLAGKSLANTESVWELRRNLISEERYSLMAIVESDKTAVRSYLDTAQKEEKRNEEVMAKYLENYRVDKSKIDELKALCEEEKPYREKFQSLIKEGTDKSSEQAFEVYEKEYKPILDRHAALLKEIGDAQIKLADNQVAEAKSLYRVLLVVLIIVMLAALAISILMVKTLLKAIILPLYEIENAARALSEGDFNVQITHESGDEFGEVCGKMQESFATLKQIINEISKTMEELGNGNLTRGVTMEFPGEMGIIAESIDALVKKLNDIFSEIIGASDQIDEGASQVSDGSQALAQGASEQASSVEELSATLEEVSGQVKENSENAQKASNLAVESGQVAESTLGNMQQLMTAMEEITTASGEIQKVIKVIDDIAFQTNILALNAAVEAARAGEAGKGFAVVADEVRNLAAKSADAAKSTTDMIDSSIAAVERGENMAKKTHDAFEELDRKVQGVVGTVHEISEASAKQAVSIEEITAGVDQISSVVQTNTATSEESAAASEELSAQAGMMKQKVSQFKLSDGTGGRSAGIRAGSAESGFEAQPTYGGGAFGTGADGEKY